MKKMQSWTLLKSLRKGKRLNSAVKKIFLITVIAGITGCSTMEHLDQLLTLQEMSKNTDLQQAYVAQRDKQFVQLLDAVKNNSLSRYPDKTSIRASFGNPIFTKFIKDGSEKWLYRYSAKLKGSEKVYLYFDSAGQLVKWEYVEA